MRCWMMTTPSWKTISITHILIISGPPGRCLTTPKLGRLAAASYLLFSDVASYESPSFWLKCLSCNRPFKHWPVLETMDEFMGLVTTGNWNGDDWPSSLIKHDYQHPSTIGNIYHRWWRLPLCLLYLSLKLNLYHCKRFYPPRSMTYLCCNPIWTPCPRGAEPFEASMGWPSAKNRTTSNGYPYLAMRCYAH